MRASFSLAASVASLFRTRFSTPSSMMVSKICGVALFNASCSSQPALRRDVPHSEVPAAVPMNGAMSTDQEAITGVPHAGRGAHHLGGECLDVGGGNPRCTETRG